MEVVERLPEQVVGSGLVVRRWRPDDAPAMHEAITASVEHLRPWMPWIRFEPQTVVERRQLIERWGEEWRDGGDLVAGIWQDGEGVGGAGLHRRLGAGGLEIGYWVHADRVGRGIATAASRELTDLAFSVPGIDRVEIHHDVANAASGRVPTKLGFEVVADVAAGRDALAPSETGTDRLWRTTRGAWLDR